MEPDKRYAIDKKNIGPSNLLDLINAAKKRVKNSDVLEKLFDKYDVDLNAIDIIPVMFKDLDVSATTDHGVIYLNNKLINDDFDHYLIHEISHWAQQTCNSKPTKGSTDDTYLDNKSEQEGFQNQTAYIEETKGKDVANEYVNQVLDHHDIEGKERIERKKDLMKRKAMLNKLAL